MASSSAQSVNGVVDNPTEATNDATNTNLVVKAAVMRERKTDSYHYVCHGAGCSAKAKFRDDVSRYWRPTHGSKRDPAPGARFLDGDDITETAEGMAVAVAAEATLTGEFVQPWEQRYGAGT